MGATLFVQPFDLLKNRMQLAGRSSSSRVSFLDTARAVVRNEGVLHLYDGCDSQDGRGLEVGERRTEGLWGGWVIMFMPH